MPFEMHRQNLISTVPDHLGRELLKELSHASALQGQVLQNFLDW